MSVQNKVHDRGGTTVPCRRGGLAGAKDMDTWTGLALDDLEGRGPAESNEQSIDESGFGEHIEYLEWKTWDCKDLE